MKWSFQNLLPIGTIKAGIKYGSSIASNTSSIHACPHSIANHQVQINFLSIRIAKLVNCLSGHLVAVRRTILEVFCKILHRVFIGIIKERQKRNGSVNIVRKIWEPFPSSLFLATPWKLLSLDETSWWKMGSYILWFTNPNSSRTSLPSSKKQFATSENRRIFFGKFGSNEKKRRMILGLSAQSIRFS